MAELEILKLVVIAAVGGSLGGALGAFLAHYIKRWRNG